MNRRQAAQVAQVGQPRSAGRPRPASAPPVVVGRGTLTGVAARQEFEDCGARFSDHVPAPAATPRAGAA